MERKVKKKLKFLMNCPDIYYTGWNIKKNHQ